MVQPNSGCSDRLQLCSLHQTHFPEFTGTPRVWSQLCPKQQNTKIVWFLVNTGAQTCCGYSSSKGKAQSQPQLLPRAESLKAFKAALPWHNYPPIWVKNSPTCTLPAQSVLCAPFPTLVHSAEHRDSLGGYFPMFLEMCIGSGGLFITMHTWGAVISTSSSKTLFLPWKLPCPPFHSKWQQSLHKLEKKRKKEQNILDKGINDSNTGKPGVPKGMWSSQHWFLMTYRDWRFGRSLSASAGMRLSWLFCNIL